MRLSRDTTKSSTDYTGRRVYIAFRIIQVGAISEREQCFKSRFDLFVEWYDVEAANMDVGDLETYSKRHWEPQIRFTNADDYEELRRLYMAWKDTGFVGFRASYQGIFRVDLDFSMFPFDVQALTIELTVGRERATQELLHVQKVQFRSSPNHPNTLMRQVHAEWAFLPLRYRLLRTTVLEGDDGLELAQFMLFLPVERRYGYYLYNVYLVAAVIQVMGFGIFALEPERIGERMMLAVTLFLLMVVLKFTLLQHQPQIPCMTHLDKYMVSAYFVILAQYLYCCVFYAWATRGGVLDQDDAESLEYKLVLLLTAIFLIVQCFFAVKAWQYVRARNHRVSATGQMDERLQELLHTMGYDIKNGEMNGCLQWDIEDLDLPADCGPNAKLERQRALRNTWIDGERNCARRSMFNPAREQIVRNTNASAITNWTMTNHRSDGSSWSQCSHWDMNDHYFNPSLRNNTLYRARDNKLEPQEEELPMRPPASDLSMIDLPVSTTKSTGNSRTISSASGTL